MAGRPVAYQGVSPLARRSRTSLRKAGLVLRLARRRVLCLGLRYEHRTGEIYLTDAINAYAGSRAVYGQVIQGRWYDTGNPLAYLTAQFASALADPEYGPHLRRLARDLDAPGA